MTERHGLLTPAPDSYVSKAHRFWRPKPVGLLGRLASTFIAFTMLVSCFYAWASWNIHRVASDPAYAGAEYSAGELLTVAAWLYLGVWLPAGAVFVIWLRRARLNSEWLCASPHTRARGWAVTSWIVPFVNLWFPYQIVRDVWKASNPNVGSRPGAPSDHLRWVPGSRLLVWWWAAVIGARVANAVSAQLSLRAESSSAEFLLNWLQGIAIIDSIGTACDLIAGVLIIVAVRQISRWQDAARAST